MGFPIQNPEGPNATAFVGPDCLVRSSGFTCPRYGVGFLDILPHLQMLCACLHHFVGPADLYNQGTDKLLRCFLGIA